METAAHNNNQTMGGGFMAETDFSLETADMGLDSEHLQRTGPWSKWWQAPG